MTGRKTANSWWYVLAAVSLMVGIVAFVTILTVGMGGAVDGLKRIEIPEITEIEFTWAGTYTVFWEQNGHPSHLEFILMDSSTNQEIKLTPPRFNSHYSHRGQRGQALFEFTIEKPGTYAVYINGSLPEQATITIGQDFNRQMAYIVFWAILALVAFIVSAVFLVFKGLNQSIQGILRDK